MIDFDAALAEQRGEPVTFRLGGTVFEVPTPLPVSSYLAFEAKRTAGGAKEADLYLLFLREVVEPAQLDALDVAIRASRISVQGLVDLSQRIIEESSGFPTKPPSGSRRRQSARGAPSSPAA